MSIEPQHSTPPVADTTMANTTPSTEHSGAPPAKRRKISPEEKAAKAQEKEEAKARKEEERERREHEKRVKEAERAEVKAKREQEKKTKEEERQRKVEEKEAKIREKEEEKRKKEQAQPKLSSFFVQKPLEPRAKVSSPSPPPSASESVVHSAANSPQKKTRSDYEQFFLPFEASTHTTVAPFNHFLHDKQGLTDLTERAENDLDFAPPTSSSTTKLNESSVFELLKSMNDAMDGRGFRMPPVHDLLALHQGDAPSSPLDLSALDFQGTFSGLKEVLEKLPDNQKPTAVLEAIPVKYLHFSEDIRPPYCGTWTKQIAEPVLHQLMRNPFQRKVPQLEYDYDSEAEWEDPGEGEDLLSDGDDEMDEVDEAEDMSGFIDDDDNDKPRRKLIAGEVEAKSTGLCWANAQGTVCDQDGQDVTRDMEQYRMGTLLSHTPTTIDPFSTVYWEDQTTRTVAALQTNGTMNPPRTPFGSMNPNTSHQPVAAKVHRFVPNEHMKAFKDTIVQNADLTQIHMIEVLKKTFPSIPKDAIQSTLKLVAKRNGRKEPYRLIQ